MAAVTSAPATKPWIHSPSVNSPPNERFSARNHALAPATPAKLAARETRRATRTSTCTRVKRTDCNASPSSTPGPANPHHARGEVPGGLAKGAGRVLRGVGEPMGLAGFRQAHGAFVSLPAPFWAAPA